jgi:hypothetical protein
LTDKFKKIYQKNKKKKNNKKIFKENVQVRGRGWATCGSANPGPHSWVFVIFLRGNHPPWLFWEENTIVPRFWRPS